MDKNRFRGHGCHLSICFVIFFASALNGVDSIQPNILNIPKNAPKIFPHFQSFDPMAVIQSAVLSGNMSDVCSKHVQEFIDIINNKNFEEGNDWALYMIDSTALVPNGFLTGSQYYVGHFDECLAIVHPKEEFTGQHCMLKVEITKLQYTIYYGLCLPSTCSVKDINSGLADTILSAAFTINATDVRCWTNESKSMPAGDWAIVCLFAGIVAIVLSFTICHLLTEDEGNVHPMVKAFSLISNGKGLLTIRSGGAGQMGCLHGLRVLSMVWIVLGHTYEATPMIMPTVNLVDMTKFLNSLSHILLWNAIYAVDTFFFLSGLLVAFVFFRECDRKKSFDVPLSYIHRYLRLTAPYAVLIVVVTTIYPYFGKGPLWYDSGRVQFENCRSAWWTSILYISNYYSTSDNLIVCPGQTWYLPVDMQLFWLSPIFLYPVFFWPKIGTAILALLTLASTFLIFGIDQSKDFLYSVELYAPNQFKEDYVPTHMRAPPWLVGALLGVIICYLKKQGRVPQLSKPMVAQCWICSAGTCLGCIYGAARFLDNAESTRAEVAAYLAFTRLGWGLGLAWIVFACIYGYGGPVNDFLSYPLFEPLGKLSYGVFLIHITLQNYRAGIMQTNTYAGDLEVVYYFIGDYILSTILATLLYLFIEAPVGALDSQYLRKVEIFPFPRPTAKKKEDAKT